MAELIGRVSKERLIAAGIDNLLAAILSILVAAKSPGLNSPLRYFVLCSVYLGYFFVQEWLWSRTVGKKAMKMIVVSVNGARCSMQGALMRTVTRVLEANMFLFGAIPAIAVAMLTRRKQRIGDLVGGTLVVNEADLQQHRASAPELNMTLTEEDGSA